MDAYAVTDAVSQRLLVLNVHTPAENQNLLLIRLGDEASLEHKDGVHQGHTLMHFSI